MGPLVIAGVMVEKEDEIKLKRIKVKDSKLLTPQQREKLYPLIRKIAKDIAIIKISARELDEMMETRNLNRIEAEKMAEIIKALGADVAYVDAPQVSTDKFKNYLLALAKNHTEIVAENKADKKFPTVSAASILAKVERDREVEKIKKVVGFDFGVGYSHDKRSIAFVRKCLKEGKHLEFIRHKWSTVENIKKEKKQKKLEQF
ncbi:MAG TPA: ribonuclease HII [archaeon]|nr:ribonuclease HII [archaeon]